MAEDPRYAYWADLVAHLVTEPPGGFPHEQLLRELSATFGALASWNWQGIDGSFCFDLSRPIAGWPTRNELTLWSEVGQTVHPLLCWYRATMDPPGPSIDRVPTSLVPQTGFALVRELLAPVGVHRQLSIPYALSRNGHQAFVLAQDGADFTDADVTLARQIQPMLAVIDRQTQILATAPATLADAGLTARETAVLELLGRGMTAARIGHILGISPRTVHTHLAHVYHKLNVTDRLQTVMAAQRMSNGHPAQAGPGAMPRPTQVVFNNRPVTNSVGRRRQG